MSDNEDDVDNDVDNDDVVGDTSDNEQADDECGDEDDEECKSQQQGQDDNEEEEEKKDEEEGEADKQEQIFSKPLTEELMYECLSVLSKTGDGLAHAFIRLDIHDMELTDISLARSYIHLRFVDISNNTLKSISPLSPLTHLLTLKADSNQLTSVQLDDLPYLQSANFSKNQIRNTQGIGHAMLETLNLSCNRLTSIEGLDSGKLHSLTTLELRGNALVSTRGLNIPTLKTLYLLSCADAMQAANKISRLEDLGQLIQLKMLHLRENQLEVLDGFTGDMANLHYINLRLNQVSDLNELKKLKVLPALKAIVLSENTVSERDDYRLEMLIMLRRLDKLDKDEYCKDERREAESVCKQRVQDELLSR